MTNYYNYYNFTFLICNVLFFFIVAFLFSLILNLFRLRMGLQTSTYCNHNYNKYIQTSILIIDYQISKAVSAILKYSQIIYP